MTKAEAKDIPIISEAKVVKARVVRLMELQRLELPATLMSVGEEFALSQSHKL
jgi:hypothetical protein